MPKPRKNEMVCCTFFHWRLSRRRGVWCADGRSNSIDIGRHSLGTRDKAEALKALGQLDEVCAIKQGLIEQPKASPVPSSKLTLAEGRRLFEAYIARPRVLGGVKPSTRKRYRTVFDKFGVFCVKDGTSCYNQVDAEVLSRYATYLEKKDYAPKTLINELTTLKVAFRWFIEAGHLSGCEPIKLSLRKVESERAYCYRPEEVKAIITHCRENVKLHWLGDVTSALAGTGLRIDELVNLKWIDIYFSTTLITLADESGRNESDGPRRSLKSGRSRSFPIHPDLVVVLKRLTKTDEYVFHGPRGGRLKADTVRRVLIREVLKPLSKDFPASGHGKSFIDGRLHSFRHYFVSMCAAARHVSERMVMEWVGHADSAMVRHYFHVHDAEAQRQTKSVDLLGSGIAGCSGDQVPVTSN